MATRPGRQAPRQHRRHPHGLRRPLRLGPVAVGEAQMGRKTRIEHVHGRQRLTGCHQCCPQPPAPCRQCGPLPRRWCQPQMKDPEMMGTVTDTIGIQCDGRQQPGQPCRPAGGWRQHLRRTCRPLGPWAARRTRPACHAGSPRSRRRAHRPCHHCRPGVTDRAPGLRMQPRSRQLTQRQRHVGLEHRPTELAGQLADQPLQPRMLRLRRQQPPGAREHRPHGFR